MAMSSAEMITAKMSKISIFVSFKRFVKWGWVGKSPSPFGCGLKASQRAKERHYVHLSHCTFLLLYVVGEFHFAHPLALVAVAFVFD